MNNNNQKITMNLLRESIWEIEDKIKIQIEGFREQEVEIKNIKTEIKQIFERFNQITIHNGIRKQKNKQ